MGFAGNLRTLSLPEVVQTLARIQATGILRLAADEGHRDVVFNEGQIIGVEFKQGAERQALLQRMIMQGKIDATAAAAITATGSETQVVRSLVTQGLVSEEEVLDAEADQAEEELISLCTWESADFVFHDAGPEEPEASELVDKYAKLGLTINSGSLLMEAARRMDEWSRLKERIPDIGVVLGVANGQDEAIAAASAEYPAVAVIPLIDAVRTVEDIVRDAVVTRLEVYQVLVDLLAKALVCQLSREDLIAHADYWKEQHNNQLAAKLYRRALAQFPSDSDTQIKLGACLEYLGDSDEAAQCYGQLARGYLDEGDPARASEFARHAVALRSQDPKLRQLLARCHFMRADTAAAASELKEIVRIYLELGQLEDARGTCLKILEMNRGDEFARRELARIFSRVENDQQSEDVIVCVQCGTVNHREAQNCTECKCALQLTCMSCSRVVAVSDRLCIFCGANPHAGNSGRRGGGSPSTSRIINRNANRRPTSGLAQAIKSATEAPPAAAAPVGSSSGPQRATSPTLHPEPRINAQSAGGGSGTDRWRNEIDQHLGTARANEEAGNYEAALKSWREVAKLQPDNPQILSHIKSLEVEVNQQAVEYHIDLGHRLRSTRHPWRAAKSYRIALRLMSADDPRVRPVSEAMLRAEKEQRKIGLLYSGAAVALLVCGFLAARPYYQISRFDRDAMELNGRIAALADLPQPQVANEISEITAVLDRLTVDADGIRGAYGEKAKRESGEMRSAFYIARSTSAEREMTAVEKALQARNPTESERLLTAYQSDFGNEFDPHRVQVAKDRLTDLKKMLKVQDDERKSAPQRLTAAKKHEEEHRLGSALEAYRGLVTSTDAETAAAAKAAVALLEPKEKAFLVDWNAALAVAGVDLVRGEQAMAGQAEQARLWGREGEQMRLRQDLQDRLKAAEAAYAALPTDSNIVQLEAFVAAHATAPQAAQAKVRIGALQARIQGRDQALALFRRELDARQYEQAWQTGRDLINGYGPLLAPGQIQLPLVVESMPSGATVSVNGKVLGRTPLLVGWHPAFAGNPGDSGDLVIAAPGWKPNSQPLDEAGATWRKQVQLERESLWQLGLGKQVSAAYRMPDGAALILAGDTLADIDGAGQVRWRHGLGTDDLEGGRSRLAHMPAVFPDGRMAFGLPGKDVSVIDAQGNPLVRITTQNEVRGRPLVYTNDVFGADTRLAIAAESIQAGSVGAIPIRIPLQSAAISGPLALEKDLDKVLIIGTVSGHLMGIMEQPKKVMWDVDLQATDISQLLPVSDNLIITVLDGSKLAAIQVRPEMGAVSWTHQLKAPAVGEPALTKNGIVIASGSTVLRFGRDGTTSPAWPLSSPASSPVATNGDIVAVGAQGGTLHLFKGDLPLWVTPCGQPVTAVVILKDRVIAGLQDGTVLAFGL
jgi:tetratricopeptide (TPR) repeat protein